MNLLHDPIATIRDAKGVSAESLPGLLARLVTGPDIQGFPRLAAEQRGYWWRFIVRCAARALRTAELPVDLAANQPQRELAATLREALLEHSEDGDWTLYQSDPSRPGFLQVPTPGGKPPQQDSYRESSCALLTAIIGTKEHERKSESRRALDAEALVYALVEYQGGVIFGGRGNYESQLTGSRSGAGSGTPFLGVRIDGSHVLTLRHDVQVLLDRWDKIARDLQGRVWALWTEQWDGETPVPATRLDPAFIPLARMVRLGPPRDGIYESVWFRASEGSRVADHTNGGNLGDPFTPLVPDPKVGHLKVRGTLAGGYDYREVVRLLFPVDAEEAVRSPTIEALFRGPPRKGRVDAVFEGMAFEQGKTRGFHRRVVRLPPAVPWGEIEEVIHSSHTEMLGSTREAKRILSSALAILLTGEPRVRDDDRKKIRTATQRVEELVDRHYLDFLFAAAASEDPDPTLEYRRWLVDVLVNDVFPGAVGALPRNSGRWLEQQVSAEAYLRGRLRKMLRIPLKEASEEAL